MSDSHVSHAAAIHPPEPSPPSLGEQRPELADRAPAEPATPALADEAAKPA